MKSSIIGFIKRAGKTRDAKYRNQLYVFLICLGLSVFIWLLIKMSQSYVTTISYKYEFSNTPAGKIIRPDARKIQLIVKGKGADLFSLKYLSIKPKIVIDLGSTRIRAEENSERFYILLSWLKQKFTNQLDPGFQITEILPDTLFFEQSSIITKKIPVNPVIDLEFRKQFLQYDSIIVTPSCITLQGPAAYIDTLTFLKTESESIDDLHETKTVKLKIIKPFKGPDFQYSSDNVDIMVPVEKFTESNIKIPIIIEPGNPDVRIKTFPAEVTIKFLVALKDYPRISKNQFQVKAKYDGRQTQKLELKLTQKPSFVRSVKLEPVSVDFIIMKK